MFATRNLDENAVYGQQTAAAAKPLNQGVRGLGSTKTPAGKTPFRTKLHDENVALATGKTLGKIGDGKIDNVVFITPAGPKVRAPLGNKTTNAKTNVFANPIVSSGKKENSVRSSPRQRAGKVKIFQADPLHSAPNDDEYPEIEYMAPRGVPLADHAEEWPHDHSYPEFEGKNLTRGWVQAFAPEPMDSDEEQNKWTERFRKAEERERRERESNKVPKGPISTTKARAAAAALSKPLGGQSRPSTSTADARISATISSKKSLPAQKAKSAYPRARVASNTTLGYASGRAVSSSARAPLSTIHARSKSEEASPFAKGTSLDDMLRMAHLSITSDSGDEEDNESVGGVDLGMDGLDDLLGPNLDFRSAAE